METDLLYTVITLVIDVVEYLDQNRGTKELGVCHFSQGPLGRPSFLTVLLGNLTCPTNVSAVSSSSIMVLIPVHIAPSSIGLRLDTYPTHPGPDKTDWPPNVSRG